MNAADLAELVKMKAQSYAQIYTQVCWPTGCLKDHPEKLSETYALLCAAIDALAAATREPAAPAVPYGWCRGHITPGGPHGPPEYYVEFSHGDESPGDGWFPVYRAAPHPSAQPAEPKERKPLTDDELWKDDGIMSANADAGLNLDQMRPLVRAIERAHGIDGRPNGSGE